MYRVWSSMLERCYSSKHPRYKDYGERGIKVCDRWHNYIGFLEDMGPMWRKGLTIERLDNNGDYTPENCIWATAAQQANNRRNNRMLTVDGVTSTVSQWAHRNGLAVSTVFSRLEQGWTPEAAVKTPLCH